MICNYKLNNYIFLFIDGIWTTMYSFVIQNSGQEICGTTNCSGQYFPGEAQTKTMVEKPNQKKVMFRIHAS